MTLWIAMNRFLRPLTLFILLLSAGGLFAATTQERVHHMSHTVMPFDMSKTVHIFRMMESGGVEKSWSGTPQAGTRWR